MPLYGHVAEAAGYSLVFGLSFQRCKCTGLVHVALVPCAVVVALRCDGVFLLYSFLP